MENIKSHFQKLDWLMLALIFSSSAYGCVLIKSATNSMNTNRFIVVQIGAALLGTALIIAISAIDFEYLLHDLNLSKYIYAAAVAAMLMLMFFGRGSETHGRDSWINFFGIINIQPSEIVKFLYIICFAKQLDSIKENPNKLKNIGVTTLYAAVIIGLVIIDNLGSALVFVFITFAMCFAAGITIWYFLTIGAVTIAAAPTLWQLMRPYQQNRILSLFDLESDPLGIGYQVIMSRNAIGSGGAFGAGYQNGYITQSRYLLPEQHTDFIFAAAGEEFGFLGCMAVIVLLALIVTRAFYVSFKSRTDLGSLMCVGAAAMLMAQTMQNIGMCIGLTPVIGVTLPFFSYGGSSVISCYLAAALIINAYSKRHKYYFEREAKVFK